MYNTDGSIGAARGAGVGIGYYKSFDDAFVSLKKLETIEPDEKNKQAYIDAFALWEKALQKSVE